MTPIIRTFTALLLLCFAINVSAANLTDTVKKDSPQKSAETTENSDTLKIAATFYSNDVFMGRSNKTAIPYLTPEIKYTFGMGIYLGGNVQFLPQNTRNKLDGGELNAGYEFDLTDALSGDVSFTKFFYNTNSTQITSSTSSTFNASFEYEIENIITPSVAFDYTLNKTGINDDIFLNLGISHEFSFGDEGSEFTLSPTIGLNAGTQYFFESYLEKKLFKTTTYTAEQQQLISQYESGVGQFKMLDYELSVPLKYNTSHFGFEIKPEYDILQNDFKSTTLSKTLGVATSPGIFWVSAGISWKF